MKGSTIKAWCCFVLMLSLLQGCGALFHNEQEERMRQEAEFKPYEQKNNIEGYREFIAKYPENMFIPIARGTIQDLQFTPCEQKNTIDGYREFIKTFPENRNRSRAAEKIAQLEFKRVEDADTMEGYREFLRKNSRSNYTMLAQQRLQDLEFQSLDKRCRDQYGFDLLLYRLNVSRLQKDLESAGASSLADFTLFASIDTYKGQRCFHTLLIYGDAMARLDMNKKESSEPFFASVIAKLLVYLDQKFTNRKALDGFSFSVDSSASRFYGDAAVLMVYYFPAESVHQFAQGLLKPGELLAQATVSTPANAAQAGKPPAGEPALPAVKGDGRK
jgi:hypothetical protein